MWSRPMTSSVMDGLVNDLDTEKFINVIKQHPAIWDLNHENHNDRVEKKIAWNKVISTFVPDYDDKSLVEKKNLGNAFSRKWKSLRDCYSREVAKKRRESLGGSASFRKEYVYFEHLKFLGTLKNNNANEEDGECSKDNDCDPDYPEEPPTKRVKRCKEPKNNNDKDLQNQKTADPDRLFMLSLVPEIKKIPAHLKLEVKTALLAVIANTLTRRQQRPLKHQYSHNGPMCSRGGIPSQVTLPTVHVTVPISINYDPAPLQPDIVADLSENLNTPIRKCKPARDAHLSDNESEESN